MPYQVTVPLRGMAVTNTCEANGNTILNKLFTDIQFRSNLNLIQFCRMASFMLPPPAVLLFEFILPSSVVALVKPASLFHLATLPVLRTCIYLIATTSPRYMRTKWASSLGALLLPLCCVILTLFYATDQITLSPHKIQSGRNSKLPRALCGLSPIAIPYPQ